MRHIIITSILSLLALSTVLTFGQVLAQGSQPEVHFLSPQEGEILRGEVELRVEGIGFRDLELVGVAYFEYSPDGQTYHLIASDNRSFDGFQVSWDTRRVPDGWYFLRATIIDLWNQRASTQIRVAVDNVGWLPLYLRVPQDFPTIEAALAQARVGAIIQVDAAAGPYPPFTVEVPGIILESVNGRAQIRADWWEGELIGVAVSLRGERVQLRGFRIEGPLEIEGQDHVVQENILETVGKLGIVVRGRGHVIEHNRLLGAGGSLGVLLVGSENLLQQNEISDYEFGAFVLSSNNHWEGNIFRENWDVGIALLGSSNTIRENIFQFQKYGPGIGILSSNNEVVGNLFEGSEVGIEMHVVTGNLIKGNTFLGNREGLLLCGGASRNTIIENRFLGNETGVGILNEYICMTLLPIRENTIRQNDFIGNRMGLENRSPWVVDARENYWGSPSGPYHPEANPGGLGDPVSDNVLFEPWLKQPVQKSRVLH